MHFKALKVNGANPKLKSSEKIQLTNSSGKVIDTPSAPNARRNAFSACAWRRTCRLG